MNNQPIGFFDSGVGQLSILIETKKLLPRENFVIFADQSHNPYGEKTQDQIKKYATDATIFLLRNNRIKILVLACNTATVLALDHLRKKFDIPIIGTVPAVKPAFSASKNKKIAIMSTPATAKSVYLADLINQFGNKNQVLTISCAGLEEAIEILDTMAIDKLLKKYLRKVKKFEADVVVLGCTHYPLIKSQIERSIGPKIKVIDSGSAIAKRIKEILEAASQLSSKYRGDIYYTTGNPKIFSKVASALLDKKIKARVPGISASEYKQFNDLKSLN